MQYIIKFIKNAVKYILPESLYKIAQRLFWRVKGEFYEEKSFYKKILADGKTVPVAGDVKVSIICNVWNTPLDFLEQMIGSVLNQNYCNWELLINNCSNSDNVAVENFLQLYASEERIKIFRTVNHGIAANSNCLIERASGDFIFLMDHDDLLLPDTLVEMVAAQQKHDSDFIYADEIILFMNERHLLKNIKKPFSMPALERENFINHPALIRKELLIFSGGLR